MWKRIFVICAMFVFLVVPIVTQGEEVYTLHPNDLTSEIGITIEKTTGAILFEKNGHQQAYPASMTKIMTGILLLEHVDEQEQITMTTESLLEVRSNSIVEFTAGEKMSRDTALDFLMMLSANDVAVSIAEHISGSQEAFGKLMTERARELGAMETQFTNPSGLHQDTHFTTAYDMALIMREALNHPRLVEAMSTERKEVRTSLQKLEIPTISGKFEQETFLAGKTGFTNTAGATLAQASEKNDVQIINIVMASSNPARYEDIEKMSIYGFSQIEEQVVIDRHQWTQLYEIRGKEVRGEVAHSLQFPTIRGKEMNITTNFHVRDFSDEDLFNYGIFAGEEMGQLDVLINGVVVESLPVLATETILFNRPFHFVLMEGGRSLVQSDFFFHGMVVVGSLGVLVLIVRTVNITRRKLRKKKQMAFAQQSQAKLENRDMW